MIAFGRGKWLVADPTMNGAVGRARLGRHTDDLIAGLALGADEILGMVRVHVLSVG